VDKDLTVGAAAASDGGRGGLGGRRAATAAGLRFFAARDLGRERREARCFGFGLTVGWCAAGGGGGGTYVGAGGGGGRRWSGFGAVVVGRGSGDGLVVVPAVAAREPLLKGYAAPTPSRATATSSAERHRRDVCPRRAWSRPMPQDLRDDSPSNRPRSGRNRS
jgi:hypothetical protein